MAVQNHIDKTLCLDQLDALVFCLQRLDFLGELGWYHDPTRFRRSLAGRRDTSVRP